MFCVTYTLISVPFDFCSLNYIYVYEETYVVKQIHILHTCYGLFIFQRIRIIPITLSIIYAFV